MIPYEVDCEIQKGRDKYPDIPAVNAAGWAQVTVLNDEEEWTALQVKAALGGGLHEHIGESAVIACARHRRLTAVLDDRAAVEQAEQHSVRWIDSMTIVVKAYKDLYGRDRESTVRLTEDLLATEMFLPFRSGEELFGWAYEEGLLP